MTSLPLPHDITSLLRRDEGERPFVYTDSVGKLTLGVGRNVDIRGGKGLSSGEIALLLQHDVGDARVQALQTFPWFTSLDEVRQAVILSMLFVLGLEGAKGFPRFLADVSVGDWVSAESELATSKWAAQAPQRVGRLASMIRTGIWQ